MGSKQANEINSNKESKAESTRMVRRQDPFSCVRSRKSVSKKQRKAQKRGKWREDNQHPWNSEKRSEQQEQCE